MPAAAAPSPAPACPVSASGCPAAAPMIRLGVALVVAGQCMLLGPAVSLNPPESETERLVLVGGMLLGSLVVCGLLGVPMLVEALRQLARGRPTMELLFALGVSAAMGLSVRAFVAGEGPVYFEVVSVLLAVHAVGQAVNARSRDRALGAARALTDPVSSARLDDGRTVPAAEVRVGDRILVAPGESVPVDGCIVEGSALVRDLFTGELLAAVRRAGDAVSSGSVCEDGTLTVEATAPGTDRRIDRLAETIDSAAARPTDLQRGADRWVAGLLPFVLTATVATLLYWWRAEGFEPALLNALSVLMVACPCAAGLATPLAVWTAMGELARRGLVLKGGDALERLADADSVLFDKTGTLADERLTLRSLTVADAAAPAVIAAVERAAERAGRHPVARLLSGIAVPPGSPRVEVLSTRAVPGRGVEADVLIDGRPARASLLREEGDGADGLVIAAAIDGRPAARAVIGERLRDSAAPAVARLERLGLAVRVITGDGPAGAAKAAALAPVEAGVSAEAKHAAVTALREAADPEAAFRRPIFVGDGVNDAAAMAASHVAVAMGGGDPLTVRAASAALMTGDLTLIADAVALARRTVASVRTSLWLAAAYNVVGVAAAACGLLHPILAAVLMTVSSAAVGWRSFGVATGFDAEREARLRAPGGRGSRRAGIDGRRSARLGGSLALPADDRPASVPGPSRERVIGALHVLGFAGQAALLAMLAGYGWSGVALMTILGAAVGLFVARSVGRLPDWAEMIAAMMSLGGLGMNLGWWADLGFGPAAGTCCHCGTLTGSVGMYAGMLAAGVPAMYLLRLRPVPFSWRSWCCVGPLALGVPGMCLGMRLGGMLSPGGVLADYAAMTFGMCAGMLVAHVPEWLLGLEPARPTRRAASMPSPSPTPAPTAP